MKSGTFTILAQTRVRRVRIARSVVVISYDIHKGHYWEVIGLPECKIYRSVTCRNFCSVEECHVVNRGGLYRGTAPISSSFFFFCSCRASALPGFGGYRLGSNHKTATVDTIASMGKRESVTTDLVRLTTAEQPHTAVP